MAADRRRAYGRGRVWKEASMNVSMLGIILAATLAALPASGTIVYVEGTFNADGDLNGGTFSGSFDMDFPTVDTASLSSFDVVIDGVNGSFEIDSNQSDSVGVYYDQSLTGAGALVIEFLNNNNDDSLDLFFNEPFTGNGSVVPVTTGGYDSQATLSISRATSIASGVASTTPLPEPSTYWLTSVGGLLWLFLRRPHSSLGRWPVLMSNWIWR